MIRLRLPTLAGFLLLAVQPLAPAELDLSLLVSLPALFQVRLPDKASYYLLEGQTQADGTLHQGRLLTAAHRWLPLGSVHTICREDRPRVCATVRITDRMGRHDPADRQWDLSRAAAKKLGMLRAGVIEVMVK